MREIDEIEAYVNGTYPEYETDHVPCGNMAYDEILRIKVGQDPREIMFVYAKEGKMTFASYHNFKYFNFEALQKGLLNDVDLGDK
jgi:hypothetical protein